MPKCERPSIPSNWAGASSPFEERYTSPRRGPSSERWSRLTMSRDEPDEPLARAGSRDHVLRVESRAMSASRADTSAGGPSSARTRLSPAPPYRVAWIRRNCDQIGHSHAPFRKGREEPRRARRADAIGRRWLVVQRRDLSNPTCARVCAQQSSSRERIAAHQRQPFGRVGEGQCDAGEAASG